VSGVRLLVTGASGNIGLALRHAVPATDDVVMLGGPRRHDPEAIRFDIGDRDAVAAMIARARPHAIIHLASLTGAACEQDPDAARRVNVDATRWIVEAAGEAGVGRIVFASTAAVYGDLRRTPVTEADELILGGVYASTKREAEELLQRSAAEGGPAVDILRIFNVYGPAMTDSLVGRLVASDAARPVTLAGLDSFVRDYVHVDDVVAALLLAVDATSPGSRVLNIGTGIPRSNRDLVDELSASRGLHYIVGPERESYSCADIAAARRELGFDPAAALRV
jgi:nucleoside-diphosphate-sugar epimerase